MLSTHALFVLITLNLLVCVATLIMSILLNWGNSILTFCHISCYINSSIYFMHVIFLAVNLELCVSLMLSLG
jgi:hypothetical protein